MIRCVFFDRDGVLIKNYGYFCDKKKIKWLKGAISSIKILNKRKIKVIIITNQSGVARGYFDIKKLEDFHNTMKKHLLKSNAKIDEIFYCPYYEKGIVKKYKKKSKDRKPNDGMIKKALKKYKLKSEQCFMIGDQSSDYLCAKKSNIKFEYKKKFQLDKQVKKIIEKY